MSNGELPINPVMGNEYDYEAQKSGDFIVEQGLTKREYFAAMAMQGILAAKEYAISRGMEIDMKSISTMSVEAADALLKEIDK